MNAPLHKDSYKIFHPAAYAPGTTHVYSNYTPRHGKHSNVNLGGIIFAGLQGWLKKITAEWQEFFDAPQEKAVGRYKRVVEAHLGHKVDVEHMKKLHYLGYLPIKVKAVEEGLFVPYGVPAFTIQNTVSGFGWVTNMLETDASAHIWPVCTSATTAFAYRKRFEQVPSLKEIGIIPVLGHDFSYRGMFGREASELSGFGHLLSFQGSDNLVAGLYAEKYYLADIEQPGVYNSVNATEHSVMCSYGKENELDSLRHLMKNVVPSGILSVVSDTWDFWKLVTQYLPELKDEIMARDGTVVIRPDSGDPVKILTGYRVAEIPKEEKDLEKVIEQAYMQGFEAIQTPNGEIFAINDRKSLEHISTAEAKGLIECLGDIFGTTETSDGLKLLDPHIGAIYGDSITLIRQHAIIERLLAKGYVPSVVLGIGSFSYQYITRDTHGTAVKATAVRKNDGSWQPIFKDPKTDSSKKSAKGLLMVLKDAEGNLSLMDNVTEDMEDSDMNQLKTVYVEGVLELELSLDDIRQNVEKQL